MIPMRDIPGVATELLRGNRSLIGAVLAFAAAYYFVQSDSLPFAAMLTAQLALFVTVIYIVAIGADWMVNSAARIADTFGVSQLMIGLTVVAFGTSAPEGAVSLVAGFQGNGDITIANVVGSNIFNICFILGGMAVISPLGLPVRRELMRRDTTMLILATMLLFLFVGGNPFTGAAVQGGSALPGVHLLNLRLEFGEGVILVLVLVGYLVQLYRSRQQDARSAQFSHHWGDTPVQGAAGGEGSKSSPEAKEAPRGAPMVARDFLVLGIGLALIIAGCDILVGHAEVTQGGIKGFGAIWFAKHLGLSDYLIGVTIIAAGTSSPELIVSFVAAFKGRFDMTIGNLIGSDLFNMLGVVGVAGIVLQQPLAPPVTVAPAVIGSLLGLTALVAITWVFMWTGRRLSRWEGVVLILIGIGRWSLDFLNQPPPA